MRYLFNSLVYIYFGLYSISANADFCAIDNYGRSIGNICYKSATQCQQYINGMQGAQCVITNPTYQQPQQEQFPSVLDSLNSIAEANRRDAQAVQQQQQSIERARSSVYSKLLPLVESNETISNETQDAILSTLNRSLELNPGEYSTGWKNNNNGSHGDIYVHPDKKSAYGNICRDFYISLLGINNLNDKSVAGTSCRINGKWEWM